MYYYIMKYTFVQKQTIQYLSGIHTFSAGGIWINVLPGIEACSIIISWFCWLNDWTLSSDLAVATYCAYSWSFFVNKSLVSS